jgi:protein-tyrosine-phosphatase
MVKKTDMETNRKKTINMPDIHDMDTIAYMTDDEISLSVSRLESERNHLINRGQDAYAWEVEISYFRREQQIRKIRSERHLEYLGTHRHFINDDHDVVILDATQDATYFAQTLN